MKTLFKLICVLLFGLSAQPGMASAPAIQAEDSVHVEPCDTGAKNLFEESAINDFQIISANSTNSAAISLTDQIHLENYKNALRENFNKYTHALKEELPCDAVEAEILGRILGNIECIKIDKRNTILDDEGSTLLVLAAKYNCCEAVQYLIENCGFNNFDACNQYNKTAYKYAQEHQNIKIMNYLEEQKKKYVFEISSKNQLSIKPKKTEGFAKTSRISKKGTEKLKKIREKVRLERELEKREKEMEDQADAFHKEKCKRLQKKCMQQWKSRHEDILGFDLLLQAYNYEKQSKQPEKQRKQLKKFFELWKKAKLDHIREKELDKQARFYQVVSETQKQVDAKRDAIKQFKKHATFLRKKRAMEEQADQFASNKLKTDALHCMKNHMEHKEAVRVQQAKLKEQEAQRKQKSLLQGSVLGQFQVIQQMKIDIENYKKLCVINHLPEELAVMEEFEESARRLTQQKYNGKIPLINLYNKMSEDIFHKARLNIAAHNLRNMRHLPAIGNAAQADIMKQLHTDPYWHARYIGDATAGDSVKYCQALLAEHNNDAQVWWTSHQNNNKDCVVCANYEVFKTHPKAAAQMNRRKSF